MTSSIHLANAKGRDATIGLTPVKATLPPKLGLLNQKIYFRRYLAATEHVTHEYLFAKGYQLSPKTIQIMNLRHHFFF